MLSYNCQASLTLTWIGQCVKLRPAATNTEILPDCLGILGGRWPGPGLVFVKRS